MTHESILLHGPLEHPAPRFDDPRYDAVKANLPQGCEPEDFGGMFGLNCRREGSTLLTAVAEVCAEVYDAHGIQLNDLGIEKLWEWSTDGRNGFGATIVGQLLLMALERGQLLGYSAEELIGFLRTANGSGSGRARATPTA